MEKTLIMNLQFNMSLAHGYKSNAQIARRLTESWIDENMFCPHCGNPKLYPFQNNQPVADFFCKNCKNEYEIKSKKGSFGEKVVDGAYDTMIERIKSNKNPDFIFLGYSNIEHKVVDLTIIPKYFFIPDIIEKRNPLSSKARRSGWVGCNILLSKIPKQGRIKIISNDIYLQKEDVVLKLKHSQKFMTKSITARGWLFDILNCINEIPSDNFSLDEIYAFEPILLKKHSENHTIKAKIRQQLQYLRDKKYIEFLTKGQYQKIFNVSELP